MEEELTKEIHSRFPKVWKKLVEKYFEQTIKNDFKYTFLKTMICIGYTDYVEGLKKVVSTTDGYLGSRSYPGFTIINTTNAVTNMSYSATPLLFKQYYIVIPFNMLYGLLEDFFEENGIIIELSYRAYIHLCWGGRIIIEADIDECEITQIENYKIKNEAKQQAILKACEILEEKLND